MTDKEKLILCPECGSDRVLVREVTSYFINTLEYFCNSVKAHDSDAEVACLDCGATATRADWDKP